MFAMELGSCLLIEHPDKHFFVFIDGLHDSGVGLTEADQEGLEKGGVVEDLVAEELKLLNIAEKVQRLALIGGCG